MLKRDEDCCKPAAKQNENQTQNQYQRFLNVIVRLTPFVY